MAELKNRRARLTSAYHELGRQLTSGKFTVIGNYTLQRTIGQGSFGKVRLATHRLTNSRVAVKQIPKEHVASLTREIHHHRRLHHPHVLQLYEVIQSESCIWMVTELCAGGELYDYVVERGSLMEHEARSLFAQLCLAVAYIHANGIVHRDLKLENILLDANNQIKLSDFGFTREFEPHHFMNTRCGTTAYAAPEMLAGFHYLGPQVDIWSLGIILFVLLCGFLPYDDDNEALMQYKIVNDTLLIPNTLSEDAQDLLRWMLHKDGGKRPSIRQILSHPWYTRSSQTASRTSSLDLPRQSLSALHPVSPRDADTSMSPQVDYVAMLTRPVYIPFESPAEQQLSNMLQTLGFSVGQIRHSVQTNACDSAGALWWLLLHKMESSPMQTTALDVTKDDEINNGSSIASRRTLDLRRASTNKSLTEPTAPTSIVLSPPWVSTAPVTAPTKPAQTLLETPVLHAPQQKSESTFFNDENLASKKNYSLISSVKSWLRKDRRESDTDVSISSFDAETALHATQEERSVPALAPPLLPVSLMSNKGNVVLAPTANNPVPASPSTSPRDTSSIDKPLPLETSPRLPARSLDTPTLRRTSSIARPLSAYSHRLSVGSATSTPSRRERSHSLSSPQSTSSSLLLRSRQSSWNSLRTGRPRRGSESLVNRPRVTPQRSAAKTPEIPADLSRNLSGLSDACDTSHRRRPVSLDEKTATAFERQYSSSSEGAPIFSARTPRSPFRSPRAHKPSTPRSRGMLPRNKGSSTGSNNVAQPTIRKKKVLAPHVEDDWIDEEVYYVGGIGQPTEHISQPSELRELGVRRPRGGSPCPSRTTRPVLLKGDALPSVDATYLRGKKVRRDVRTPVIEEEP